MTWAGNPLDLAPSLALRNHSPTGFARSYGGSGPAQLSSPLLSDYIVRCSPSPNRLIKQSFHQPSPRFLTFDKARLQPVTHRHQFINLSNDATLLDERWEGPLHGIPTLSYLSPSPLGS